MTIQRQVKQLLVIPATLVLVLTSTLTLPSVVFAAVTPGPGTTGGTGCPLPDGTNNGVLSSDGHTCCPASAIKADGSLDGMTCFYAKYVNPAIALLAALVGIVVVIAIVFGAIEYISSGGDPQRAAAGKKRITNALIGLVAFLLLYSFLQFLIPGGLFNAG